MGGISFILFQYIITEISTIFLNTKYTLILHNAFKRIDQATTLGTDFQRIHDADKQQQYKNKLYWSKHTNMLFHYAYNSHGLLGIQIHLLCEKKTRGIFFPGPTNIELIVINKQSHEYDRHSEKKTSFPFFDCT